jgi:hypothetical protein
MIVICENINTCKQKYCIHSKPHEQISYDQYDINTFFDSCGEIIMPECEIYCKCTQKNIRKFKLKKLNERQSNL